jgi:hypothetical protein
VAPNAVTDTARTGARIPLEEASPSTGTTIHAPADGAGPLALAEFIRLGARSSPRPRSCSLPFATTISRRWPPGATTTSAASTSTRAVAPR